MCWEILIHPAPSYYMRDGRDKIVAWLEPRRPPPRPGTGTGRRPPRWLSRCPACSLLPRHCRTCGTGQTPAPRSCVLLDHKALKLSSILEGKIRQSGRLPWHIRSDQPLHMYQQNERNLEIAIQSKTEVVPCPLYLAELALHSAGQRDVLPHRCSLVRRLAHKLLHHCACKHKQERQERKSFNTLHVKISSIDSPHNLSFSLMLLIFLPDFFIHKEILPKILIPCRSMLRHDTIDFGVNIICLFG